MTVEQLAKKLDSEMLNAEDPKREISGVYIGDLLSWVMGRAQSGDAWITIMSSANTIAVALLADVSVIILTEGVTLDKETLSLAREKGINVISTSLSSYEAAVKIHTLIK